ncbi:cysteine--tRNA ligase [Candidatus Woesearchaeota archaeon]|nr:cysteine--tRNA ligase [Candidatus Woesearchaeota archaeon]
MLKIYNTLTRKKEIFKSLKPKQAGMYVCGPTVYDYAHIGNFRAYLCADILRRYLEYKGYKIKQIMNLTDVEDKTIKRSQEKKLPLKKFTEKYIRAFFEDLKALNIELPDKFPKATEHIKEIVEAVKKLKKKGFAYKAEDNSTYFDISKFKNYGQLAKIKLKGLKAGARVSQDEYEKEKANDFALWKAWTKGDGRVFWETGLGKGRPGWHIECSVMATKYLGQPFDLHTGGTDLIFPHHENEIAQAEAAQGKPFVKYWFHNEWLLVEGKKMSKSYNNFYTLRDLIEKEYSPKAIRYVLIGTHYRQKFNFTFKELETAKKTIQRLNDFMSRLKQANARQSTSPDKLIQNAKKQFESAMDDDLNIAKALSAVFDFMREVNKLNLNKSDAKKVLGLMNSFDKILGVLETKEKKLPKELLDLIKKRELARKNKDYKTADKIRDKLRGKGIFLEDSSEGVRYRVLH